MKKLDVFIVAGMGTYEHFFDPLRNRLKNLLPKLGYEPKCIAVYPYGKTTKHLHKQIINIFRDQRKGLKEGKQFGSEELLKIIDKQRSAHDLLFIGHSGGGIAAYQATRKLTDQGRNVLAVFQIGSPKVKINPLFRRKVHFIQAVNEKSMRKDQVTLFGSWGGYDKTKFFVRWNPYKYAPGTIEQVHLIGGHPDYFREHAPYIDSFGQSNLQKTLQLIVNKIPRNMT